MCESFLFLDRPGPWCCPWGRNQVAVKQREERGDNEAQERSLVEAMIDRKILL